MSKPLHYTSTVVFLICAILLLLGLNLDIELDNNFYFLGGTGIDCSRGVAGTFKPAFLVSLAITDMILVAAGVFLLRAQQNRYLLLAALGSIGLLVLRFTWLQPRLFTGYELTADTNMLDALTGGCYLFYGPHDAVLLLVTLAGITASGVCHRLHTRSTDRKK